MTTSVIQRTSKGLVDCLFNAIDDLNQKKIDAEHARALAHTARTIVGVAALELDFMRLSAEQNGVALSSLAITAEKQAT